MAQLRNQPLREPSVEDQSRGTPSGWVMFWVIVALFVIGGLAYSAYRPAYQSGTTMGTANTTPAGDAATTNDTVLPNANTTNSGAAGNTSGAYVMPNNASPANNSANPNANTAGTPAQ